MLNKHKVLFCAGMNFDDVHTDCLTYKYFIFGHVYHVNIGVPQSQPNVYLSETKFLKMIHSNNLLSS